MGDKPKIMDVVSRKSQHEGHDPANPRTKVVEDLAMMLCGACSLGEDHRWQDRADKEFYHADPHVLEGYDCEASRTLRAALDLGIPIYTGAQLEFSSADD